MVDIVKQILLASLKISHYIPQSSKTALDKIYLPKFQEMFWPNKMYIILRIQGLEDRVCGSS